MEIAFCCQRGLLKVEKILIYEGHSNKLRETKICRTILLLLHSYVTVHILISLNSHTPAFHSHIFSIFQSKLPSYALTAFSALASAFCAVAFKSASSSLPSSFTWPSVSFSV
jgi:hypothetical protein